MESAFAKRGWVLIVMLISSILRVFIIKPCMGCNLVIYLSSVIFDTARAANTTGHKKA